MGTTPVEKVLARRFRIDRAPTLVARGGLAPWQLRRACEFIDANLGADPSISEVAQQCGLSGSYFSRAFKRESGFSPHQWLMRRRVERAKELLREPGLELAEIAQICGFVDQSHFARVFAKSEGWSPGRWRRLRPCSPGEVQPLINRSW